MVETLFEKIYLPELYRNNREKETHKYTLEEKYQAVSEERRIIRRLSLSNALMKKILDGTSPHELVEKHRKDKFSRWLGLGRWLPIGIDEEHKQNQNYLEEIFSNISHYKSRGIFSMDNPLTCAVYGAALGFAFDALPLIQNTIGQDFESISGNIPKEISMYKELLSTEIGLATGVLLGYIRRTRRVDWFNLWEKFGSVKRERVWNQADYIRYKAQQTNMPIGEIIESEPKYIVPANTSKDERENILKNPLFKKLGISIEFEPYYKTSKVVRSKILAEN